MTNDHKHEMEKIAVELGQSRDTLTELYRRAENVQQSEDCLGDGLPGSLFIIAGSFDEQLAINLNTYSEYPPSRFIAFA